MAIKLKELPISERPYEKLEKYGSERLTNAELLAIIIKTGTREETAVHLAQRVLKMNDGSRKDDLTFLQDVSISDFKKIKGIGRVKAIQLLAVIELAKRINKPININEIKIKNTTDIANLLMNELKNEKREKVKLILLNTKNVILKIKDISYGGTNFAYIDPKDILYEAIKIQAPKIILVHNHPSNNLVPSKEDLHITEVTNEMLKVFNIKLLDHIIVTEKEFISMNKIQEIGKERNIESISILQKGSMRSVLI